MSRFGRLAGLLAGFVAASPTLANAQRASVIIGDDSNYGRIVIELPTPTPATITERGGQVSIALASGIEIETPDAVPRNVASFAGGFGKALVTITPGSRVKPAQSGRLIILDVLDPRMRGRGIKGAAATRANPDRLKPAVASAIPARPSAPEPVAQLAAPVSVPPASETPVPTEPAATTPIAVPAPEPPRAPERIAIHVPAGPDVGAVAFRRGDEAVVVFDDTVDVDLSEIENEHDRPSVEHRQGGTILTLPMADDEALSLARDEDAWIIRPGPTTATAVTQTAGALGLTFQFARPGRTMTISDPVTGQLLLLGTLRQPSGPQTLVDTRRAAPGYVFLPTWLGLALEVSSDVVDMRVSQRGFTLQIPDAGTPGAAAVATPENGFQIPNASSQTLMRQLDAQIASAAVSPPRGRGHERVAAARTMLALGMAPEAQALLGLAANDDPVVAADPQTAALQGIAAVLAGRPDEATGLDNPKLPARGEIDMWRGLRDVALNKPAPLLAASWPALGSYPEAIRRQIGSPVMEAAIDSGASVPPSELEGAWLAFVRARRLEKAGDAEGAISAYAAIADSLDELQSVRATWAMVELKLARGDVGAGDAADIIDRQTVRWRNDAREQAMRLRAAALRKDAGQWRAALDDLKATEIALPQTKDTVAAMTTEVFKALLSAKDNTIKPLDLVAIAGDFADRLPSGADGEKLAGLLAEKLAALDLPSRAIPVLQRLSDGASSPKAKAEYALRLAQLQLEAGDPGKVETTLSALDPDALSPEQVVQRLLLLAKGRAGRGDPAGAAATLAFLDDPASAEVRAGLLAKAGDWPGSLAALQLVVAKSVPDSGDLSEKQQDLVLREATAAVHASDPDALKQLRRFESRLSGPRGDLFKVLTATAVESSSDLPRAAQELAMSRSVSDRINALKLR